MATPQLGSTEQIQAHQENRMRAVVSPYRVFHKGGFFNVLGILLLDPHVMV